MLFRTGLILAFAGFLALSSDKTLAQDAGGGASASKLYETISWINQQVGNSDYSASLRQVPPDRCDLRYRYRLSSSAHEYLKSFDLRDMLEASALDTSPQFLVLSTIGGKNLVTVETRLKGVWVSTQMKSTVNFYFSDRYVRDRAIEAFTTIIDICTSGLSSNEPTSGG